MCGTYIVCAHIYTKLLYYKCIGYKTVYHMYVGNDSGTYVRAS